MKPDKLTPKQRVLRKYKLAYCERVGQIYVIHALPSLTRFPHVISSAYRTERSAWNDAARRLRRT